VRLRARLEKQANCPQRLAPDDDALRNSTHSRSRDDVRKALDFLVHTLDVVSRHYTGDTNLFDGASVPEGAAALLHVLRDGVREREARYARWNRGDIDAIELQSDEV